MNKVCTVRSCRRKVHARNLCNGHYRRLLSYGDVREGVPFVVGGRTNTEKPIHDFWYATAVAAIDRTLGHPPPIGWEPSEDTKQAFREWLGLRYINGEWVDPRVKKRSRRNGRVW